MSRLLLITRDPILRGALKRSLGDVERIEIQEATSIPDALRLLDVSLPHLIIADIDLPGGRSDFLREIVVRALPMRVILISTGSDLPADVRALRNVELLKKPVLADQLAQIAHRMLRSAVTIPPQETTFSVADFLQLAALARRSVVLEITSHAGRHGTIVVSEGQAYSAEDSIGSGKEAFCRLAMLEEAQIACHPLTQLTQPRNLEGKLEELMLDAARLSDEAGRRSAHETAHRDASPDLPSLAPALANTPVERDGNNTVHAPEEPPMPSPSYEQDIASLLKSSPDLRGIARAGQDGAVLDAAGELDSEVACAVTAMVRRSVADVGELLGLGESEDWYCSTQDHVFYVIEQSDGFIVAAGTKSKAPATTMKKVFAAACAGR